jgi:transcription antitermination factor NusA-like protein
VAQPVSLVAGVGADYVNRVSAELGGERLHVLQWQGVPRAIFTLCSSTITPVQRPDRATP